ncbi:hypothetical protein DPEC_G00257380 [Dallia pectoralis]|uniref:Uncharacterized protein n=1 Tax=Dallia pectoralis TaxID=75939 RepID=A0ACC2FQK1_DALPE|nr:hypothetical protein DPEC_G00257380 [Dallia pectoralis]
MTVQESSKLCVQPYLAFIQLLQSEFDRERAVKVLKEVQTGPECREDHRTLTQLVSITIRVDNLLSKWSPGPSPCSASIR